MCLFLRENLCIGSRAGERGASVVFQLREMVMNEKNIQLQDEIQKNKSGISRSFERFV